MGAVPVILRRPKEPEQMQPTRHPDRFVDRHIGPDSRDVEEMLAALGVPKLDEATAAAEAMTMFHNVARNAGNAFFVAQDCHPQTIEVVRTRAAPFGIEVIVGDPASFDPARQKVFGALLQYPATDGAVRDPRKFIERAHAQGALVVVAADILALTLLTPPGELGADCAAGSTQRFGVPLGYGRPHAASFAPTHA